MKFRNPIDFIKWHYNLDVNPRLSDLDAVSLIKYFHNIIDCTGKKSCLDDIFIADIFYGLVGLKFLNATLSEDEKHNIKSFIMECWVGNGFTPVRKDSKIGKLLKTQNLPSDIYSTYYCLGSLILMEMEINTFMESIGEQTKQYFQPTGWIYNIEWSNTAVERRFDIELIQQVLMGIRISLLLDNEPKKLPYHTERRQQLVSYLKSPRYISAIYYAVLSLMLMNEWNSKENDIDDILYKFIMPHYNAKELGFREYQMENVKVFSYRGMGEGEEGSSAKHRFQSDYVTASINATTYVLSMVCNAMKGELLNFVLSKKKEIVEYFSVQKAGYDQGYGTPVKIAKYSSSFGPDTTANETCNYIIGKTLIYSLR